MKKKNKEKIKFDLRRFLDHRYFYGWFGIVALFALFSLIFISVAFFLYNQSSSSVLEEEVSVNGSGVKELEVDREKLMTVIKDYGEKKEVFKGLKKNTKTGIIDPSL